MPSDDLKPAGYSAALEHELRRRAVRLPARRRRRRLAGAAAVSLCIAATMAVGLASAPRSVPEAKAVSRVVLSDGRTVSLADAVSADRLTALADSLAASGLELKLRQVPVQDAADGRILEVRWPAGVRFEDGRAVVPPGTTGEVVVDVGRRSPDAGSSVTGLSMMEANPHLCEFVRPWDAAGSVRALRAAGFSVAVVSVEFPLGADGEPRGPALQTPVQSPPPGSALLSLSDERFAVSRNPDRLAVEVIDPSRLPDSEPIGVDAAC